MKKIYIFMFALLAAGLGGLQAQTVLLSEGFTGSGIPSGWTQTTVATDGGWLFAAQASQTSSFFPITDPGTGNFAATNDDACNCDKSADVLMTPVVNMSALSTAFVSWNQFFWAGTYSGATEFCNFEASTDGGSTWTLVEALTPNAAQDVWETRNVDVSSYAGQSSVMFRWAYNDGAGWTFGCALDDVTIFEPAAIEVALTSVTTASVVQVVANENVTGVITNNGATTVTSLDLTWSDGTNTYTDNLTGLNIASMATYNYTHSQPINVTAVGTINYTVSIDNANGNGADANTSNDQIATSITGVTVVPVKAVVCEEATGTWCGWCPRGAVALCEMEANYPNTSIGIAVHNGDPMTNAVYDQAMNVGGYPSGHVDRVMNDVDPSTFEQHYLNLVNTIPACGVGMELQWDPATRLITADVSADFIVALNGDYRFNFVITEDGVTGTNGYDQSNYYGGAGLGLGLCGPIDYNTAAATIPGASMVYDDVAREILGGWNGTANSLPTSIPSGSTQTYQYTHNLNAAYNVDNCKMIAWVSSMATGEIINAMEMHWIDTVGQGGGGGGAVMSVSSTSTAEVCSAQNGSASVTAIDGSGSYTYAWTPTGGSAASAFNLSAGTYTCQVSDGTTTVSEIIVVGNDPSNLSGSASATDDNCNAQDGSVTAIGAGGDGNYTFSWNSGGSTANLTNLASGTYVCDITDGNGCTTAVTAVVNANSGNLVGSSSATAEDCGQSNGSATVTASGGSGTYSYVWSNGGTGASITGVGAGSYTCDITDSNGCTYTQLVSVPSSSGMTASTTSSNATCAGDNDGTATVTASGGSGTFTYTWSSGGSAALETGLAAGTYTCEINDGNGCIVTETIVITEPAGMTGSTSSTDDQCGQGNGTASATIFGGAGGYAYAWSNGATGSSVSNLDGGTYACEVTDMDGCTTTVSVVVGTFSVNITGATTTNDEDCGLANGSASVTAAGGTAPYTYNWSPAGGSGDMASNLVAGTYTVEITDNDGCSGTENVIVGNSGGLTGTATDGNTTCPGDNDGIVAAAAVGGSAPYTYVWSSGGTADSESNLSVGTYTCAISDASGCAYTVSAVVNEPEAFTFYANVVNESGAGMSDGSAAIAGADGLNGGYSYEWPDGSTGSTAQGLAAGTYDVIVTDLAGCQQTIVVSVYLGLGIGSSEGPSYNVIAYPNPNNGVFNVNLTIAGNERIQVLLMNGLGQVVADHSANFKSGENHMTIDLEHASKGVYFLRVIGTNGNSTQRIVVR